MTDHHAQSVPMTGHADGAGYSAAGHEPLSSQDPRMSEPHGEMSGHTGYSAEGHGPVASTMRDAESIRQSEIAAKEPLQHDPIGNALAAAPITAVAGLARGTAVGLAELAGAALKAVGSVGKTAAREGV